MIIVADSSEARKIAIANGAKIVGSLGILVAAKKKRLIKNIKPYIEKIVQSGIFLSPIIIGYALAETAENTDGAAP